MFRNWLNSLLLSCSLCMFIHSAQAEQRVDVLAYVFPPFLDENGETGLIPDTITALNAVQNDYKFELQVTAPRRRYDAFREGLGQVVLFEMPEWGWIDQENLDFDVSPTIFGGGERYIALKQDNVDQSYFDDIQNRVICGYLGYHYGFAGYNSDPTYLRSNFRISLVSSHEKIIERVLKGTAEIGIVTEYFLSEYLETYDISDKLVVSDRYDQNYNLKIIVSPSSAANVEEIENFIARITNDEAFQQKMRSKGLMKYWVMP